MCMKIASENRLFPILYSVSSIFILEKSIIYSTKNKLNKIIKLGKDKTRIYDNVNVVYKINCKEELHE